MFANRQDYEILAKQMNNITNSLGNFTEQISAYSSKITKQISACSSEINQNLMKNQDLLLSGFSSITSRGFIDNITSLNQIKADVHVPYIDTAIFNNLTEHLHLISSIDISEWISPIQQIPSIDFSINWEKYNFEKMFEIMQNTIGQKNCSQITIDALSEKVAETYMDDEPENHFAEQVPEKNEIMKSRASDKRELKEVVKFWIIRVISCINILSSFMTIESYFHSKPVAADNTYTNIIQVSCDCIHELNIDAALINKLGYRIINRNHVKPRIKPDCSSTVTGCLFTGQIVQILDKKKKWIKVSWNDDTGNECSGWIQNYKVSEFKESKEA